MSLLLLAERWIIMRFICVVSLNSLFLLLSSISCVKVPQFIHSPVKDIWIISSFWQLQIKSLGTLRYLFACRFSFHLDKKVRWLLSKDLKEIWKQAIKIAEDIFAYSLRYYFTKWIGLCCRSGLFGSFFFFELYGESGNRNGGNHWLIRFNSSFIQWSIQ